MNRQTAFVTAARLAVALLVVACGGTSATTAPTGAGATAGTTIAAPATAAATIPAATGAPLTAAPVTPPQAITPGPTEVVTATPEPTFAGPLPSFSFVPDTGLAAKFPATIDGQPVTNVQTFLFIDVLRQGGVKDDVLSSIQQKLGAVGIDFSQMSYGYARATVDGSALGLTALRTPNTDANKLIQYYPILVEAFGNAPESLPTMTQTTMGGKNVTVSVDSDGKTTVLYVTGDVLFDLERSTDSQKTKILQALP